MIAFIGSKYTYSTLIQFISSLNSNSTEIFDNIEDIAEVAERFKMSAHYSHIILDLNYYKDSLPEDIKNAFYSISMMSHSKIILLAQGQSYSDPLIAELIKVGIYNYVLSWDEEKAKEELIKCYDDQTLEDLTPFLQEEESIEKPPPSPKKKLQIPIKEKVTTAKKEQQRTVTPKVLKTVAVFGVLPRIGVTTQAIKMANYFNKQELTACYVEQNTSGHIAMLRDVFSAPHEPENQRIIYEGLPLYYSLSDEMVTQIKKQHNYIIMDFGADIEGNIEAIQQCDIQVAIAGSTAWEMVALSMALPGMQDCKNPFFLFNFTSKKDQADILEFMGEQWANTLFADFSPDMFGDLTQAEQEVFHQLFFGNRLI